MRLSSSMMLEMRHFWSTRNGSCLRAIFWIGMFLLNPQMASSKDDDVVARRIPVFNLKEKTHSLEVKVLEKVYSAGTYERVAEALTQNRKLVHDSAEKVVLQYVDYIKNGELNAVSSLYFEKNKSRSTLARLVQEKLGTVTDINFIHAWHFGNYQIIRLRVTSAKGKASQISIGIQELGGKFYRADSWEKAHPVLMLFAYMGGNYKRGLEAKHSPRSFQHSVELRSLAAEKDDYPLRVYFDGELYEFQKQWSPLNLKNRPPSPRNFVHSVLFRTGTLTSQEFLELWSGRYKKNLSEMLSRNPRQFKHFQNLYTHDKEIKDLLTMVLGNHYVHYYISKSKPSTVKTIIFKRERDGFLLSDIFSSNIKLFVTSALLKEQVVRIWSAQQKK